LKHDSAIEEGDTRQNIHDIAVQEKVDTIIIAMPSGAASGLLGRYMANQHHSRHQRQLLITNCCWLGLAIRVRLSGLADWLLHNAPCDLVITRTPAQ
jgi:nucleotide-binding universal stress UspA family protein